MLPITDNAAAAQARYELERALLANTEWQLRHEEIMLAELRGNDHEFSVEWGKLIFAWWNETHSQSWRVVGYEITAAEIHLRVTRNFGRDLTTLTLRNSAHWQPAAVLNAQQQRSSYAQTLAQLLRRHFHQPQLKPLSVIAGYARLLMHAQKEIALVIGVGATETQETIDGVVAAGLSWLASLRVSALRLCFCVPSERSQTVIERLSLLNRQPLGARLECWEVDEQAGSLTPRALVSQAELLHTHAGELRWPAPETSVNPWRARILQLAPDVIETRAHPHLNCESFSLHGLEFARAQRSGLARVSFGVAGLPDDFAAPAQAVLTEENFVQLATLVRQLLQQRTAQSSDRRHPFYRLRAEAWLESLLRRDLRALDAELDDRFVYSQIPAWHGAERSVLDLLAVNYTGRLVVIEIKASEDAQLPLQGLDYWLRVEQARVRGEFAQRGLFAGITLADEPPLLYLVAPRLRFHRSFTTIAQCIAPEIEAYRLGLNTNWRAGVRVHTRERVNL